jgi:transcriptional regulator with PAS, ATPase and Fis domain
VRIFQQNKFIDCTISCNPILSPQKNILGKIIMLNEIKRARSLVNRLTGARASFRFKNMIGKNTRFLDSIRQAKLASKSVSTVLLLGESGTGKDVFAQAIHNESSRKDGPYIAINCAAIPRDLISCELFGYSEGAFTGSKKGGNEGKFELAGGGTIFLDEITEMPLELQTTLLRVLEDKTITRIGGKEIVQLDVRIIAASNKNIREEVKKGAFREDLYYRVNVFTIEMIPLRERKNDIPILADQFIKNISEKMNRNINRVDDKIFKVLLNYAFPGNVRELQNIIERAINIAPLNEITLDLIPFEVVHGQQITEDGYGIVSIDDMERRMILNMLRSNFSKSDIANKMKISRNTLYRRLNKYERAENDGQ